MRYYAAFAESFYYAYVRGPKAFSNAMSATVTSFEDSVSRASDMQLIDLSAYGVNTPPLEGPGSLGPEWGGLHHVLVTRTANRRLSGTVCRHCWSSPVPPKSFVLIGPGIYMSTPEFTFLQLARVLSPIDLILVGCTLCASYFIDPTTSRVTKRTPITSTKRIAQFLDHAANIRGVCAARAALSHVADGAESPQEVNLFLMMSLPPALGGNGVGELMLNYDIPVGPMDIPILDRPDRKCFRIDMGRPTEHKGAEYLGKHHDLQVDQDRMRLNALLAKGEQILQVQYADLVDPTRATRLANQLVTMLGEELPVRTPSEELAQANLIDALFGVGRLQL